MSTIFDFLTVAAFVVMAGAYFTWGEGSQKLLLHLLICAATFAVANQLGNRGFGIFGALLLAAGAGYAVMLFRKHRLGPDA
jgi:hypothetical protein